MSAEPTRFNHVQRRNSNVALLPLNIVCRRRRRRRRRLSRRKGKDADEAFLTSGCEESAVDAPGDAANDVVVDSIDLRPPRLGFNVPNRDGVIGRRRAEENLSFFRVPAKEMNVF